MTAQKRSNFLETIRIIRACRMDLRGIYHQHVMIRHVVDEIARMTEDERGENGVEADDIRQMAERVSELKHMCEERLHIFGAYVDDMSITYGVTVREALLAALCANDSIN